MELGALADAMVAQTTEALAVFDGTGRTVLINEACATLLGFPRDELIGVRVEDMVHPDDLARAVTTIGGLAGGARPLPGMIKIRHGDGSWRLLELSVSPLRVGGADALLVLLRNNALQEAHWSFVASLSAGEPLVGCLDAFTRAMSGGPDGPLVVNYAAVPDVGGRNPYHPGADAPVRLLAGPLPAALGALAHDGGIDRSPGAPWTIAVETGECAWTVVDELPPAVRAVAAEHGLGACVAVPVPDPSSADPALVLQWPATAAMAPIVAEALVRRPYEALSLAFQRRDATRRLELQAHRDALTGLANRQCFFDELGRWDRHLPYALHYVDLDRFKPINDTHGHTIGDQVLAHCARRLAAVCPPDALVARLGGDEFAVASPSMDSTEAEALAARIVAALAPPIAVDELMLQIAASVGCTVVGDRADSADAVAVADGALYAAKAAGRNRWVRH